MITAFFKGDMCTDSLHLGRYKQPDPATAIATIRESGWCPPLPDTDPITFPPGFLLFRKMQGPLET